MSAQQEAQLPKCISMPIGCSILQQLYFWQWFRLMDSPIHIHFKHLVLFRDCTGLFCLIRSKCLSTRFLMQQFIRGIHKTYPVLAKFDHFLIINLLSSFSKLLYEDGKGDKPPTSGAPKIYGSSSPCTPPDHCG